MKYFKLFEEFSKKIKPKDLKSRGWILSGDHYEHELYTDEFGITIQLNKDGVLINYFSNSDSSEIITDIEEFDMTMDDIENNPQAVLDAEFTFTSINQEYYHGSVLYDDMELFVPTIGNGDYQAIWVSDMEQISENFCKWRDPYEDSNQNQIYVLYKVDVNMDKVIQLDLKDIPTLSELSGVNSKDLRDHIDYLSENGVDGWKTSGRIGDQFYDDVAIFNDNSFQILDLKLSFNKGEDWTEYMSFSEATEIIENRK